MTNLRFTAHKILSRNSRLYRNLKLLYRRYSTFFGDDLGWGKIIENDEEAWKAILSRTGTGPKMLLATGIGAERAATTLESLLGVALAIRGAQVHVVLCDSFLPACEACLVSIYPKQEYFVAQGPKKDLCTGCYSQARKVYQRLGFAIHNYSDLVTAEESGKAELLAREVSADSIRDFTLDGLPVGEHALAGALRFFARATLDSEPHAEAVLRRYFQAALLTTFAFRRLLGNVAFECALMLHGIYVPQGLIVEVARKQQTRVAVWNVAYKKGCFIFSHDETYHHTLLNEPATLWEDMTWTTEKETALLAYLKSRWKGDMDWIKFHNERTEYTQGRVLQETGLDFSKPVIGLLTNVLWDAQLHYPANAFANQVDWILETVRYFSGRPELQLAIRVHPAEVTGSNRSRQLVVDEIKKAFPSLPANVAVIPPESRVSTYLVMGQCNAVIIYGTKTGVELASVGIPVIVAGEAWIKNKKITMDVKSIEHYFQLLDSLPVKSSLKEETVRRARMYGYHFFFRRMIPVAAMEPIGGWPPYKIAIDRIQELAPGRDPGLDLICDGLLRKTPFVYREGPAGS
jgi:hypothetical protein